MDNREIWNNKMQRFEPNAKKWTNQDKNKSINDWCDRMALMFEKYRDEFEKTLISIPLFTAKILAKHGALDCKDIDFKEKGINTKFISRVNLNEELIYKTFDRMIQEQKHIEDYLKYQRNPYQPDEMPY